MEKERAQDAVSEKANGGVKTGFVLLREAAFDTALFRRLLQEEWELEAGEEGKDGTLVFHHEGMMAAASLMPAPVPNGEAEENAKNNYLWPEGPDEVKAHKAHILLAVMGGESALARAVLFVQAAATLMRLPGAFAVYTAPTVYPAQAYRELAGLLKDNELPMPLLVYVGLYRTEKGVSGYTHGLADYGADEVEVLDSAASLGDLYSFLLSIANYLLLSGTTLNDGETIGFDADEKLPITRSPGISVEGESVKIEYMPADGGGRPV